MIIVPITVTHIDWNSFIKTSEKILGYSPTRVLDAQDFQVGSHESFLYALGSFKSLQNVPKYLVEYTLKHIHISFLININESLYLNCCEKFSSNITFLRSEESKTKNEIIFIATGNLYTWKEVCLTFDETFDERELSYKIYELLRKFNIFNEFRVEDLYDGSHRLERRV